MQLIGWLVGIRVCHKCIYMIIDENHADVCVCFSLYVCRIDYGVWMCECGYMDIYLYL